MIEPKCDKCQEKLKDFGGLAVSPPYPNPNPKLRDLYYKFHLCKKCWQEFIFWMELK